MTCFTIKKNGGLCCVGKLSIPILIGLLMTGCGFLSAKPKTLGEMMSGYTYIPIDPTKVQIDSTACTICYSDIGNDPEKHKVALLDALPDNSVRLSMEVYDNKGNVTYGVSKIKSAGTAYRLTADYVNSDTVNKTIWISKTVQLHSYGKQIKNGSSETFDKINRVPIVVAEGTVKSMSLANDQVKEDSISAIIPDTEQYDVKSFKGQPSKYEIKKLQDEGYIEYSIPVYVGIGLRITAEGASNLEDANISGIGVVGAEAQSNKLSGSLTVQTLGVNSQAVASALPVQSELSRTTAENAFVAIGSIKSMLHLRETIKYPRVVGLYLPFPGGKALVNALISELSRTPVSWCPNGYASNEQPSEPQENSADEEVDHPEDH